MVSRSLVGPFLIASSIAIILGIISIISVLGALLLTASLTIVLFILQQEIRFKKHSHAQKLEFEQLLDGSKVASTKLDF